MHISHLLEPVRGAHIENFWRDAILKPGRVGCRLHNLVGNPPLANCTSVNCIPVNSDRLLARLWSS